MTKSELIETASYFAQNLVREPLLYLQSIGLAMNFFQIESAVKILFYLVSSVATIILAKKYLQELRKMQSESNALKKFLEEPKPKAKAKKTKSGKDLPESI